MKNAISRLLRHYIYDLKLKSKLVISHAILILFPTAILSGLLFVRLYGMAADDALRSAWALSAQTASSIGNLASHAAYVSKILKGSSLFYSPPLLPENDAPALKPEQSQMDELFHLIRTFMDDAMITGICIYYDDSIYPELKKYNAENNQLFAPVSSVSSCRWFKLLNAMDDTDMLCPGSYLNQPETDKSERLAYISKIPYIPAADRGVEFAPAIAYLAIYIDSDPFNSLLVNNSSANNGVTYMINSRGVIGSASDKELANDYYVSPDEFSSKAGRETSFSLAAYPTGGAYTACFPIPKTDWYIVSLIPAGHIAALGNRLMIQMIIAYLLFTIAPLLAGLKLSDFIANRIIAVASQMESVRTGPPKPLEVAERGRDEIGVLTDTYNYLTAEIIDLMNSQEKASEDLRMAEFRALQAQINPHFLYNTLDMINWLSRTGRKEDVSKAVQALSRFYKLTLSKRGLINTIEEELRHTELYVELQNMRYDNCVGFVIDVPDELSEYTIPKLTFQPIVENAWIHGIMGKEEKRGNILLTGWLQNESILFLISDDGAGIPSEKLMSMTAEGEGKTLASETSDSVHIGIYNTDLRLKRLYGDAYGLSFWSSPDTGTEVTVKIPAKLREDAPS